MQIKNPDQKKWSIDSTQWPYVILFFFQDEFSLHFHREYKPLASIILFYKQYLN